MKSHLRVPFLWLIAAAALAGCGKNGSVATNPTGGSSSDQTEATAAIAQDPAIIEDGVSDDPGDMSMTSNASGLAAIHPLTFRRVIRERDRRFEFVFSDSDSTGRPTRAVVIVRTHLQGSLVILAGIPGSDGSPLDSTTKTIRKPLDEQRVRRVLLVRVRDMNDPATARAQWRVAAVSGVQVTSRGHTVEISSLRVQSGGLDTTITNPLGFIRLRNILELQPNAPVQLTVTTNQNDDVVVLHHNFQRFRLHNNGDDTYSGEFRVGLFARGMHHFAVDALTNATLFDDTAPYDSQRWAFPYVIAPEMLQGPDVAIAIGD